MSSRQLASLESICSLIADCPHSTPYWTDSGFLVIRNQNIKNGKLDLSERSYTDQKHYLIRIRRAKPQFGDLIFTREAPMGDVCMVPEGLECCVGQRQVLLRPNPEMVVPRYLLYAIQSPEVQHEISWSEGTGSTVSNVRIPVLKSIKIPLLPLNEQAEAADLLGALDDRITLLRETNATLEAIAQALFKSWFVDFDPVHAKQQGRAPEGMDEATAALFPDSFEESELDLLPKGWLVGKVSDLAEIKGGKQLEKTDFSDAGPNPVFGGAGVMGHTELSNATGLVITVGRVGAYCGQFFWHFGDAWVNNNASRIVPTCGSHGLWLYQWLKQADIDHIKKGAAQPFVSNGDIAAMKLVIPAEEAIQSFSGIAGSLYEGLQLNNLKAQTLASLRDTLLPRLISGQLRLPEAEAMLAEV